MFCSVHSRGIQCLDPLSLPLEKKYLLHFHHLDKVLVTYCIQVHTQLELKDDNHI
jgi:hypothetical protein